MKNLTILTLALLGLFILPTQAQFDFGVKLGIHSFDLNNPSDIIFPNNDGSLKFKDAKIGFQGGLYSKLKFSKFSLESRLMLNSTKVEYTFDGQGSDILGTIKEERFTKLDIPVLFGFDLFFLEAKLGPVAHINLNSASDLFDINEYDERFSTANYGFRTGLEADLGGFSIGLEYEGNFSKFGDHIAIGGTEFSFDDTPSRLILNVGIEIF